MIGRERKVRLPTVQELTKEQELARLLPLEGQHLIVGGPGTGKSVVALLRARRHQREHDSQYVFLAYNVLLIKASKELMSGEVHADKWISWFKQQYQSFLEDPCPTFENEAWNIDWALVTKKIEENVENGSPNGSFLIIDEGQDMPQFFYQALAGFGFVNFFVVADQNQTITEQNSKIAEIADALLLNFPDDVNYLSINHRNNFPVARLAIEFWIDDPASPRPELPETGKSSRTPVLLDYGEGCGWDFDKIVSRLLLKSDREPSRLFGLITHSNRTRQRWLCALQSCNVKLDRERRVVTYASGMGEDSLSFKFGGIMVLNSQAVKGLEFDNVIVADINDFFCRADNLDEARRKFYVMISRARERVTLLRCAGQPCPVNAILPNDSEILERWC